MSAGLPKYITVNLSTLSKKFSDGEEVSLESLTQKRMLNLSGREAKLPLKVLLQLFHLLQSKPRLTVAVPETFVPASNPVCLCILLQFIFIKQVCTVMHSEQHVRSTCNSICSAHCMCVSICWFSGLSLRELCHSK